MNAQNVDSYLIANAKYFNSEDMPQIQATLLDIPDDSVVILQAAELKDPTVMLLISIVGGGVGIDRFMLNDLTMGVIKLLTAGGFGILVILDWFTIMEKTKDYNYEKFMTVAMQILESREERGCSEGR